MVKHDGMPGKLVGTSSKIPGCVIAPSATMARLTLEVFDTGEKLHLLLNVNQPDNERLHEIQPDKIDRDEEDQQRIPDDHKLKDQNSHLYISIAYKLD